MKKISKIKEVPNYKLLKKLTFDFNFYEPNNKTAFYSAYLQGEFIELGLCFKKDVVIFKKGKDLFCKEFLKDYNAVTIQSLETYNHSLILSNEMDALKANFNRTFNALDDLRSSIKLCDNASV